MCLEHHQVREDYKEKIRLMTEENKTCKFLDYDCQKGIWQFEVNRFWDFWVGWLDLSGGWFLESSELVGDWVPTSPGTIRLNQSRPINVILVWFPSRIVSPL